jgi:hypothetical protein
VAIRGGDAGAFRCFSPLRRRVGYIGGPFVLAVIVGPLVIFLACAGMDLLSAPVAGAMGLWTVLMIALGWSTRVDLEEDGVRVAVYGRERFVAYSRLVTADVVQKLGSRQSNRHARPDTWEVYTAVRLTLENKSHIEVGISTEERELTRRADQDLWPGATGRFFILDGDASRMVDEINARVRAVREKPPITSPLVRSLMRGSRTFIEWRDALVAAACAPTAYRGATSVVEALWRVLEDPDAPREARAGAAVALRRQVDDDGCERMRVVAQTCESPKLSIAVETLIGDDVDEASLVRALQFADDSTRNSDPR